MSDIKKAKIAGCGSFAPDTVVTNSDLEKIVETTDDWITTRTGIKERRIAVGSDTSLLATNAAREALKSAGILPEDVDLVITATVTPNKLFPSTSCFVQSELGINPGTPAFDVSAACSGFLFALDVAEKYIKTGVAKKALVIGVDVFSKIVDWTDRATCVLFGDAAGAVVLTPASGESGILSSHIHSDGSKWETLYADGTANKHEKFPVERDPSSLLNNEPFVTMKGNETFRVAVNTMRDATLEALNANNLTPSDISLLIPHQANIRIMNAMQVRLKLRDDQVYSNIDRYGNTSAGSIPLALHEAVTGNRLKAGDLLVMVAFGGGLTWASTAIRW